MTRRSSWSSPSTRRDMGRVIGRDGRIANAIRSLLRVMATREAVHVELEIVGPTTEPPVAVARITGAKGLRGAVRIEPLTDWPEHLDVGARLRLEGEEDDRDGHPSRARRPGARRSPCPGSRARDAAEALLGRYLEVEPAPLRGRGQLLLAPARGAARRATLAAHARRGRRGLPRRRGRGLPDRRTRWRGAPRPGSPSMWCARSTSRPDAWSSTTPPRRCAERRCGSTS